jgi:hypothetical protein
MPEQFGVIRHSQAKKRSFIFNIKPSSCGGDVAQLVESLSSNCKALTSDPSTPQTKKIRKLFPLWKEIIKSFKTESKQDLRCDVKSKIYKRKKIN